MAQWKFELDSVLLGRQEIEIPVGWDSNKPTLTRNTTYHGVFRTFTVDLTFVLDGYDYVKELYDTYDVLAQCSVYIYEYNNSTHEFELQDIGVLDFTDVKESDKEKQGITLPISDTGFNEKLKGREDVEINYNDNVDLDGNAMSEPIYIDQTVLGMEVLALGTISTIDEFFDYTYGAVIQGGFAFPTINYNGQIAGGQSVTGIYDTDVRSTVEDLYNFSKETSFYIAQTGSELTISGIINAEVADAKTPNLSEYTWIRMYRVNYNLALETGSTSDIESEKIRSWESPGSGIHDVELDISGTYTFKEGDMIKIYGRNGIESTTANTGYIQYLPSEVSLKLQDKADPTISKGAFIFDVFNRTIESITGIANTLTSDLFGEGGAYRNYTLQNGFLLRNYLPSEAQMSFKFKELFQNIEKIFNIGLNVVGETVDITRKKDYFKDGIVLTVDKDDIEADSFTRELDPEYYYSDIEIGYSKSAYEEISGLEEYNNKSFFNTILSNLNNKLEAISKIRGDGYGMEFARRLQKVDDNTEDSKYDKDVFILNIIQDGLDYIQRTTEGFTSITGIDDITTPINLEITPRQNLGRFGWMLTAGLQKFQSSLIKYNSSDVLSDLSTTQGGITIKENQDITYDELEAPLFTGKKLMFTAPLSMSNYNILKSNPYNIVKVWNPIESKYTYGWIREVGIEAVDKSTNWELIEAISATELFRYWLTNTGVRWAWNSGAGIQLNN